MKRKLAVALIGCVAALVSHAGTSIDDGEDDEFLPGVYQIPTENVAATRKEALEGSPDAAQRLYDYYAMYLLDRKEAIYWAQISAENGNPAGQHAYGSRLLKLGDEESKMRALYWLRRAAGSGVSASKDLLRLIEEGGAQQPLRDE